MNYHIGKRREHVKNLYKIGAIMCDLEMHKWSNNVGDILNAVIYSTLGITQDCFTASNFLHANALVTPQWIATV
jgi:hypothetical protein